MAKPVYEISINTKWGGSFSTWDQNDSVGLSGYNLLGNITVRAGINSVSSEKICSKKYWY